MLLGLSFALESYVYRHRPLPNSDDLKLPLQTPDRKSSVNSTMDSTVENAAVSVSKPDGALDLRALPALRSYVESKLNPEHLSAALESFDDWAVKNSAPSLFGAFGHRPVGTNPLIAQLATQRQYEFDLEAGEKVDIPPMSKKFASMAADLAALELHAPGKFDEDTNKYLGQRMLAADQFEGVAHEIATSRYFIRKGAAVDPAFLKNSSKEDLKVLFNSTEVPVQCKAKPEGAGREIIGDVARELMGCIARDASDDGRRILVSVNVTGSINGADIPVIRQAVRDHKGISSAAVLLKLGDRLIGVSVTRNKDQIDRRSAESYLHTKGFHYSTMVAVPDGTSYKVISVVGIDARPSESAWRSLRKSVRHAADQLEGGPPGIVAVHYASHFDEIESLRPGTRRLLHEIAPIVGPMPHVGAVLISKEPDYGVGDPVPPGDVRLYQLPGRLPDDLLPGRP